MQTRTAPHRIGGRYRVDGLLGEGGMALVFDAFDELLERPVAVKVLRAETQELPGMRSRFQQEARLAARLVHPNIVAVLDYGEDHESFYLVMEWLPGTTLRHEIARGPVPPRRVGFVVGETLAALDTAHRFGVLHRDIKPSNILVQRDGHIKITDFGIAKSFDARTGGEAADDATRTGFVLGTPGYLAPERQAGRSASVQSDLYAVGAVMVEALTGQRVGPGSISTEGLPPALRDVAARALSADPRNRFASADAMAAALRAIEAPPTLPAAPVNTLLAPPARSPVRRRAGARRRALVAATALIALAAAGFAFLAPQRANPPTRPATLVSTNGRARSVPDATRAAILGLASALADGGLPGDAPLARALDVAASRPAGSQREASGAQALALAQVLFEGGGISAGQYSDVVTVLQRTGATVPATTTTSTTTTATAPPPAPPLHGHGHDGRDGGGDDQG